MAVFSDRLPAGVVKEFVWCPVAAWLAVNLGVAPPPTPRMLEGVEGHRGVLELLRGMGFGDARLLPPLYSRRWPLVAMPDAYSPSRRAVLEVKWVSRIDSRLYRVQALLYGFIAAENGLDVERVGLVDAERRSVVWYRLDWGAYARIDELVRRVLETVSRPVPPAAAQPPAKCRACRWRRWCPERSV